MKRVMRGGDCVQLHRMLHSPNGQEQWSARNEQPVEMDRAIRCSKLQVPRFCHVLFLRPKPTKKDRAFPIVPEIIGHVQPSLATAQNELGSSLIPISKTEEWPDCRTHILRQKTKLPLESLFLHAVG